MTEKEFYKKLHDLHGNIRRCRGPFLYTVKNTRITDLYQENGRAILGWGGGSAFTMLKNTLNRGITGSFMTDFSYRLRKAVSELFGSERNVFVFSDAGDAFEFAGKCGEELGGLWKPWMGEDDVSSRNVVVFEPPLPWTRGIFIAAVKPSVDVDAEKETVLPAPLEAAVTRSIYDLVYCTKNRLEKDWFIYDKYLIPYFERKGPYLWPKVPAERYDAFVEHCLSLGIAVNPDANGASIVPFGADKGVFECLKKNPFHF